MEPNAAPRRWDELSRRLFGAGGLGPPAILGALAAGVAAALTGVLAHDRPIAVVVAIAVIGTVVGAGAFGIVFAFGRSGESRRALEAFIWSAELEYARLSELSGTTVSPDPRSLRRFARNVPERPDNRWIRVEILVADGQLDEARSMADRMPTDTPLERFEQAADLAWLDWVEGRDEDDSAVRATAAEVAIAADETTRSRVDVGLAVHDARRLIAAGSDDPGAPLRAARDRLGHRADGAILTFIRRISLNALPLSAILVLFVLGLDALVPG